MEPAAQEASIEAAPPASDKTNPFTSTESKVIIKELNGEPCPNSSEARSFNATNLVVAHDLKATTVAHEQENPLPDKETASNTAKTCNSKESKAFSENNEEKNSQPSEKKAASNVSATLQDCLLEDGEVSSYTSCISHETYQESQASQSSHYSTAAEEPSNTCQATFDTSRQQSIKRAAIRPGAPNVISMGVNHLGLRGKRFNLTLGEEFILNQSDHDVGAELIIIFYSNRENSPPERLDLLLRLYFDPNSDYILLVNKSISTKQKEIVVRGLPISSPNLPITIGSTGRVVLSKPSYRLYCLGEHILDITTFPRRYISLDSQGRKPMPKGAKRTLESSSPQSSPSTAKRVKTTETGDVSNVSTIVHTNPSANELVSAGSSSDWSLSDSIRHPFEGLKQNSVAKLANASKEEDYALVYEKPIFEQPNSLVFKAHHSKIPGKLIVVKLWRSEDDLKTPETKGMDLPFATNTWLNEVKQHFKVSQHPDIASIYGFDARLLTIYMEHVDAPSLESYCRSKYNAYCQLSISEAKQVLYPMVNAINFIHNQGIAHNDIKPANILYSEKRGPVLIDFGTASAESIINSGGTRWYMPPEYEKNHRRGRPGDIFALGVVLLFLLRRIPLPESRKPPLDWDIGQLKRHGREAEKARKTMEQWMHIVGRASERLENTVDSEIDETLKQIVADMVEMDFNKRITGPEIVEAMKD